jgi:hypothetical protein
MRKRGCDRKLDYSPSPLGTRPPASRNPTVIMARPKVPSDAGRALGRTPALLIAPANAGRLTRNNAHVFILSSTLRRVEVPHLYRRIPPANSLSWVILFYFSQADRRTSRTRLATISDSPGCSIQTPITRPLSVPGTTSMDGSPSRSFFCTSATDILMSLGSQVIFR